MKKICVLFVYFAVRKVIEALPFDLDQLVNDFYTWFKLSSAQRFDYADVQREVLGDSVGQFFLKPVASRWLSMEPFCQRIIDQYIALQKYFIDYLPKHEKVMIFTSKARYKRLKETFEDPTTLVYLNFDAYFFRPFTPFLVMFRQSQPLVHVLYQKANELVRQCMTMFIKMLS